MGHRHTITLDRSQVLAHRRRTGGLDSRLASSIESIRAAAQAGLQDSMPRAAVLSLHARVDGIAPHDWAHPALVQVWGPRFSAYAVPSDAVAAFTLGRLPLDGPKRRRAEQTADRLAAFLDGRAMTYREAGTAMGVHPNSLRYGAPTGRILIRWEGAGQPVVWTVDPPEVTERDARADLVRRYLHVFGPDTVAGFAHWAGVTTPTATTTFDDLGDELVPVETPIGPAWMLADDVDDARRSPTDAPASARLLPSGDSYWLHWGASREILVAEAAHRDELWTPRVWPGAVMVDGEIVGTWRRSGAEVELTAWRDLAADQRLAVEGEAAALPIPGDHVSMTVRWADRHVS